MPIKQPPKRVCSPEGDKKNCGKEMIRIPYKRRPEDAQTLYVYVCPECDSYDKWPREQ